MKNMEDLLGSAIRLVDDAYDAVKDADALLLLTEWREYQYPEFDRIRTLMRTPVILDGRNIWGTYKLEEQGFDYAGVGIRTNLT
jgi:UDPglucose 6-dehydrogenase